MVTSYVSKHINWTLVSSCKESDRLSYEYEAPISDSDRKYHLSVVVSPDGEYQFYSVI